MADPNEIVGHKTFDTGEIGEHGFPVLRHEPLTRAEADAIIKSAEDAEKKRATDMPTEKDAVNVLWSAWQRLKELGWQDTTYAHALKQDGLTSRLIELGSSGIHEGYYHKTNNHDVWWIGPEGSPSHPCLVMAIERKCPYCVSDNAAIRDTYFDQTCKGCVERMNRRPDDTTKENK